MNRLMGPRLRAFFVVALLSTPACVTTSNVPPVPAAADVMGVFSEPELPAAGVLVITSSHMPIPIDVDVALGGAGAFRVEAKSPLPGPPLALAASDGTQFQALVSERGQMVLVEGSLAHDTVLVDLAGVDVRIDELLAFMDHTLPPGCVGPQEMHREAETVRFSMVRPRLRRYGVQLLHRADGYTLQNVVVEGPSGEPRYTVRYTPEGVVFDVAGGPQVTARWRTRQAVPAQAQYLLDVPSGVPRRSF